jgi:hypothetical protein
MLSKIEDLAAAVIAEMDMLRTDVMNWGLSPIGIDRVLYVLQVYDVNTAKDLVMYNNGQDTSRNMLVRLGELRTLKQRVEATFKKAEDAEWMAEFLMDSASTSMDSTLLIGSSRPLCSLPS